jgi:hypothetical protein
MQKTHVVDPFEDRIINSKTKTNKKTKTNTTII